MGSFLSLFGPPEADDPNDNNDSLYNSERDTEFASLDSFLLNKKNDINNITANNNNTTTIDSVSSTQRVHCLSDQHKIIIDFDQGMLPPEPQLGNIDETKANQFVQAVLRASSHTDQVASARRSR